MKITLSALLHDIGKFYHRAKVVDNNAQYSDCGRKFFNENINKSLPDYEEVVDLYFNSGNDMPTIINEANNIALGHDVKANVDNAKIIDTNKKLNIIFNEISIEGLSDLYELELTPLSNLKNKKQDLVLNKNNSQKEYAELYQQMQKELDKMNQRGYKSFEELHQFIYPIIKEYTVTVPLLEGNQQVPTVSLFDHLKLTTAIANCLKTNDEDQYVIIDYDLSGIQKFIYKVAEGRESKPHVAKLLRARSFYLNILTDFVAYYIVKNLGLTYENVLYSSGGRGRILAPKNDGFVDKIKKLSEQIEKSMYYMHNAEISFSIAYTNVKGSELVETNISDLVREGLIIVSDKKQKFKSVFQDNNFVSAMDKPGKVCPMCFSANTEHEKCSFCSKLLKVNDQILTTYNEFIIECIYEENYQTDKLNIEIPNLGYLVFHTIEDFKLINPESFYLSINNHLVGETKRYARSNIGGKSFEEIAENSVGDEKLAVIKMDVDNLGYIFLNGIKKDKETISKNLTLSRMSDYFFTKRLVEICNQEKYLKSVYINYAGGDDLAIVTPASMSLDLVNDIVNEFKKFTGFNKAFHISAGIEIFSPSAPVRYAIERAEDNLAKSKNLKNKQSFTILDVTLGNDKLTELLEDVDTYSKALENESLSRSGLYEIYTYIINSLDKKDEEKAFMRFIPLIAYSIKRNMNDYWFNKLKEIFIVSNVTKATLEYYKVVFAFALLKTRK